MGCCSAKQGVQRSQNIGAFIPTNKNKKAKNRGILPPIEQLQSNRPSDFGKLPTCLSDRADNEEKPQAESPRPVNTKAASEILVSRVFELGQIMGHGDRFISTATLAI